MRLFKRNKPNIPRRRLQNSTDFSRMATPTATSSHVFKRNRTITGTTSVYLDGVGIDTDLESPRKHTHKLSITRRKVAGTLLTVVAAIIAIGFLVSHLTARVAVGVSDTSISKPIAKARYEKVISEYLDSNPLSRLSFLLDEKALTNYVTLKLPEVEQIYQKGMSGLGETSFVIKMRTPIAGWGINGKQYYVDSSGIPFEENYFSLPVVQIVDKSGVSVQNTSTAIASKRFLAFVGRVVSSAKNSGYTVTQAVLPPNTTRELELHLKEVGYYIKLSIDRPAGEQVEDMVNAVRYFAGIGRASSLRYIDVRVSGKAFYK